MLGSSIKGKPVGTPGIILFLVSVDTTTTTPPLIVCCEYMTHVLERNIILKSKCCCEQ